MHLDATEHNGQLVFLHSVKPGPANQSYGLQVAALAGVPKEVIRRAKSYLATLESLQTTPSDSPQGQLPLAMSSAVVESDRLRKLLDDIDPDSLSPSDALELLYRLKCEVKDDN